MHFTEGIVLEQKDFKENDRVLSVFTKDYGIIKVLARGIRKSTSKLSSQIDLFSFVEISFVLGSGYKVLSGAYLKDGFFNLKQDLKKQNFHLSNHFEKPQNYFHLALLQKRCFPFSLFAKR